MARTGVLVVDDHAIVREALTLLLANRLPALEIYQAASLTQALQCLRAHPRLQLVVLDLQLPDSQGIDTLRRMRAAWPATPVVVLSALDGREQVLSAIDEGAVSYVCKSADAQALTQAIERVLRGGVVVPPPVAQPDPLAAAFGLDAAGANGPFEGGLNDLTDRQRDVLRLLVQGLPNKLISRHLDISEATVKSHLQAAFRRLGAASRTQAVLAVARLGITL